MYANRQDAGRKLAQALQSYRGKDVVVLALPRGGVVLGAEVAEALKAPLDVVLVRKVSHPFSSEYAVGAVVRGEQPIYNQAEISDQNEPWLKQAITHEQQVNETRYRLYYGDSYQPIPLQDKTVIIVDDGIATGLTMEAAVRAARHHHPKAIVVAVPVAPADSLARLKSLADEVVVLDRPETFLGSVGAHYQEFAQVDDYTVRLLLQQHREKNDTSRNQHPQDNLNR